jgi:hypothetical protein
MAEAWKGAFCRPFSYLGWPDWENFRLLGNCLFWAIVYFGQLFILGNCLFWAIVYFGRLFILGNSSFWAYF